jgi:hypothetical protein
MTHPAQPTLSDHSARQRVPATATRDRVAATAVWLSWPVGFLLIMAHTLGGLLSTGVFALLVLVYAVALTLAVRALSRRRGGGQDAVLLVVAGPLVFVLAGLTGPPTASAPGLMLLNGAVLAVTAGVVLVAATGLVLGRDRVGRPDRTAVLGLMALVIGTAGWMINLVARWAVVLSGASELQAEVESRAWMANVYLRGLQGEPSFLAYLLVLMDLVQLVYLALAYLGFGLIGRVVYRDRLVAQRWGRTIPVVSFVLAAVVLVSAAAAAWVGPLGVVAAWTAFVLTIPFMSTLVPYLLGGAMLTRGSTGRGPDPATPAATPANAAGPQLSAPAGRAGI